MKKKTETIVKSIQGNLTEPQANKMRVCLDHINSIEKHITDIESVVLNLVQPYLPQIELILSLPGIKDILQLSLLLVKLVLICLHFYPRNIFVLGLDLHLKITRVRERKSQSVYQGQVSISNPY